MLPNPSTLSFAPSSLAPIQELNAHFLTILLECARDPAWAASSWGLALGADLAVTLPAVRAELTRSPISLVEFFFPIESTPRNPSAPCPLLAPARALELAQITLTLAWTMARSELRLSGLVFGLPPASARALAAVSAPEIRMAAEAASREIQPRWLAEPQIWRQLLRNRPRQSERAGPLYIRLLQRQLAENRHATGVNGVSRHSRT